MLYINLDSFRCHTETDEGFTIPPFADEPYMIVTAIDLKSSTSVGGFPIPLPTTHSFLYGPFRGVDNKETHSVPYKSFWYLLHGIEGELRNPDDVIFIASLMENDDGNADALRGIVESSANSALFETLSHDRATKVGHVVEKINSAMGIPTGGPNVDDKIGVQELRFTQEQIARAEQGFSVISALRYQGDGGDYSLFFKALNRGQNGWRSCPKCQTMFWDGFPENKGRCPAGGAHNAQRSFNYFLPHGKPLVSVGGQEGWGSCSKCLCMFFNGFLNNKGRCPAGGTHNAQGSFNYFLPHDHSGAGQPEWRSCAKCQTMFFNGFPGKGVCSTGGGHNAQGSFNYKLDFQI